MSVVFVVWRAALFGSSPSLKFSYIIKWQLEKLTLNWGTTVSSTGRRGMTPCSLMQTTTFRTIVLFQSSEQTMNQWRAVNNAMSLDQTQSVEQSPSWEANSSLAIRGIPHILWIVEFRHRVHKSPTLDPVLSQINPVHNPPPYFLLHFPLSTSEGSSNVWGFFEQVFRGRVVSASPNPKVGGPLLVGCQLLPIQYIRSHAPYVKSITD
jgi:hypothetical protein